MTAPATFSSKNAAEKARMKNAGKEFAAKNVAETFAKSTIHDNSNDFPKFDKTELKLGKVLGKGGFGTVYEVRGFDATTKKASSAVDKIVAHTQNLIHHREEDDEVNAGEIESRKFIAEHCLRHNGDARYAVKFLSPSTLEDPANFIQGIIDMAVETRILSDTGEK
jgi:hypothetical protein